MRKQGETGKQILNKRRSAICTIIKEQITPAAQWGKLFQVVRQGIENKLEE